MSAAAAYLGCFKNNASDARVLPEILAEQLTDVNSTEQCWKLAAASEVQAQPLFGVSGRKCLGGKDLARATWMGAAPESACDTDNENVSVMVAPSVSWRCVCAGGGGIA
jgi:hypothetical protein